MNPRRRPAVLRATVLATAVAAVAMPLGSQVPAPAKPVVGRSLVATTLGIVATSQPLAARVGVQILERGGNAVDAAIATNAALGLMEPTGNGVGGDLFAIVYDATTDTVHALNASGWSPAAMSPAFLAARGIDAMPVRGVHSVTVPGAVAGWDALRQKFGTKPFAELLAPAIHYAEHGFPLSEVTASWWQRAEPLHQAHPNARHTFLVDGSRAPRAGEVFRNPDLAATLRTVAERGRDGFYTGRIAEAIVAISREHDGAMALEDLREFAPEWVTPVSTTYRGWRVYEIGPNTQGIAALMMLNLMETVPLRDLGFQSAAALHAMIEAKKLAYADMLRYVADPRFSRVPVDAMLDKARAAARARQIDRSRAACKVEPSRLEGLTTAQGADTIYLTVVDAAGSIVSLIQSNYNGFGSGLVPPGTGFMLQNRGSGFSLDATSPNVLAPRKRPLHTIIPGFMQKDGTRIGFGIIGGWNQAQAHAQFVAHVVDYGLNIQEALEAGRFTKGTFTGCDVAVEALVPEATRRQLEALGHLVETVGPRSGTFGWGQAVMTTPAGVRFGASEPRHDGAAIPQAPAVFDAPPRPPR